MAKPRYNIPDELLIISITANFEEELLMRITYEIHDFSS